MRADGKIPQLQKIASAQLFLTTDWKDLNIAVAFNLGKTTTVRFWISFVFWIEMPLDTH